MNKNYYKMTNLKLFTSISINVSLNKLNKKLNKNNKNKYNLIYLFYLIIAISSSYNINFTAFKNRLLYLKCKKLFIFDVITFGENKIKIKLTLLIKVSLIIYQLLLKIYIILFKLYLLSISLKLILFYLFIKF
jgi:hypothetical protein